MQVNVRTHHIDITSALKEYSQKKLEKLEKFFDNIQEIQVELDISSTADESKRQIAMATVWVSGSVMRAKESSSDMYASIDIVFSKLEKQIKRYKEKIKSRKKGSPKREISTIETSDSQTKGANLTTKQKKFYSDKPITPEEALEILDSKGDHFLVFRNAKTEAVNVVYVMDNGDFGLIEP